MFPSRYNNNMLYTLVEMHRKALEPARDFARASKDFYKEYFPHTKFGRSMAAGSEMVERLTSRYERPEFGITETYIFDSKVKNPWLVTNSADIAMFASDSKADEREGAAEFKSSLKKASIVPEVIVAKPFCHLVHFKKSIKTTNQPKVLLVAPMSGHFSTLLRGTVEGLLPFADVYITEWLNVRDIPTSEGRFHFDDYVSYVMEFCQKLGPDLTVIAVCQPAVPVMVAVALMSEAGDSKVPENVILMGGPIDTRKSPTEVNDYAMVRTIRWFENNVITMVPDAYKGAGRAVYPGFMQLYGFMAMNMQTHIDAHWDLFRHLVEGDGENAWAHKKFYNEYLAVMDLPAEFYLDTVSIVFQEHLLPRGKLVSKGKLVRLDKIVKTKLLCIEGERDDISGRGQTKAAIDLCSGIPDQRKHYHLQKGVGHFGIFNGRRYREKIVPLILEFITNLNFKKETSVMTAIKKAKKKPAAKKAVKKPAAKKAVKKPAKKVAKKKK